MDEKVKRHGQRAVLGCDENMAVGNGRVHAAN